MDEGSGVGDIDCVVGDVMEAGMSNVGQKYAFENGVVPREPLSERESVMLDALMLISLGDPAGIGCRANCHCLGCIARAAIREVKP